MIPIRLVTFDALHTLLTPRLPIYTQYALTFEPFLGQLQPEAIKISFKSALKQLQAERPSYVHGHEAWWAAVIKRTAVGAGASSKDVDSALPQIVPLLLKRFSSREGYRLFGDTMPTLIKLHELGVKTGLLSNADSRIFEALADLGALQHLDPVLFSEQEKIEKPQKELFLRACSRADVSPEETVHVGDELKCDYVGATSAGLQALLVRRPGPEGDAEYKERDEDLSHVKTIATLEEVVKWVADTRK